MTAIPLLQNVKDTQTAPTRFNQPQQVADFHTLGAGAVLGSQGNYQSFHGVVTGTGNVSATINIMVSNNGLDWIAYPTIDSQTVTPLTISSGASPNQGMANGVGTFNYYAAYVSAISGTNAAVELWLGI